MSDPLTVTKRKAIAREVAHLPTTITPDALQAIVNRHQSTHDVVAGFLESMGFMVIRAVATATEAAPATDRPLPVVSRETLVTILSGSLYRILDSDPDADPKRVFVIITLDKFRREREAIRKLLTGLSADLPPEDARELPDAP